VAAPALGPVTGAAASRRRFFPPPGDRAGWRRWRRYWLTHPAEGALAWAVYGLLRPLPAGWASALGAVAGRAAGALAPALSARAEANLARIRPDADGPERRRILTAMWAHLGRCIAEYAVLDRLTAPGRMTVTGLDAALAERSPGRPVIFFSGHFGNWEVAPPAAVATMLPVQVLYRPPGNRFVRRLLGRIRRRCRVGLLPKNAVGARRALRLLRSGGVLGMLVDEKTARGIPVPALGRAPATGGPVWHLARLAVASRAVLVPIRVERLRGARFRVACHPPLAIPEGDAAGATADLVGRIDALLEDWVRARPDQWLWLSQRL
jgi:KDO2-lipid IV(A) lauroyltransferase